MLQILPPGATRPDLENAIAALDTNIARLNRLVKYASDRNLPAWVRTELQLLLLGDLRAERYLGIEHGRLEEAALEERSHR